MYKIEKDTYIECAKHFRQRVKTRKQLKRAREELTKITNLIII